MGWAKFDDKRHTNEKLLAAGLAADGLDARAITYSASHETNGHLSEIVARSLSMSHNWRRLVDTLVRVGRWEPDDTLGGWWIHDYLEYNPSKQELEEKRAGVAERQRRSRQNNENGKVTGDIRVSHASVTRDKDVSHTPPDPTRPVNLKEVKTSLPEQGECKEIENTIETPVAEAGIAPRKTRSKTATASGGTAKPRERDPLFDAMAEACGHVLSQMTPSGARLVGVALSEIRSQNPTPEIIWEKATLYKEIHPTWELTPSALAKYWSELQPGRERRTAQSVKQDQLDRVTDELVEQARARANASDATSDTPASVTTGKQKPPDAPRSPATPRNDRFSQKPRNPTSDRSTEADAPKADGSNGDCTSTSTDDCHWGIEVPRSLATPETGGNVPLSNNVALERPTEPLTEPSHLSPIETNNNGSQGLPSEDYPNDADYQRWAACQAWEESETPGGGSAF